MNLDEIWKRHCLNVFSYISINMRNNFGKIANCYTHQDVQNVKTKSTFQMFSVSQFCHP